MADGDDRFLIISRSGGGRQFLLINGLGNRLIVGHGDGSGGSGGTTKQVGTSLVKQQLANRPTLTAKGTALGTLLLPNLYNVVHSKLNINAYNNIESKVVMPTHENYCTSQLKITPWSESKASIVLSESLHIQGKLKFNLTANKAESTIRIGTPVKEQIFQLNKKTHKRMILTELLNKLTAIEAARKTPFIQVLVGADETQRGNMLRITANMDETTGQIWMRIIDTKGMIVQKAGLVKTNADGFQILIGTKDLTAGKYIIQVSNHRNFSPIGVSEFQIKGVSPILPLIAVLPALPISPETPDETFKKVIFRTMMDSRVDAQCKQFENKVFDINDKNLPIPPLHPRCRCWLEGKNE